MPENDTPAKTEKNDTPATVPGVRLNLFPSIVKKQQQTGKLLQASDIIQAAHVSRHVVYRALSGELREVPLDELAKLCAFFDVLPGELLEIDETKKVPLEKPKKDEKAEAKKADATEAKDDATEAEAKKA